MSVDKGTYLLLLRLAEPVIGLPVGKLGALDFVAGYYLYIGSALGPGGLPARLVYHSRRVKSRPHWHIDYLRAHCRLLEAWSIICADRLEHAWVNALHTMTDLPFAAHGFGASDSPCASHLFFSAIRPSSHILMETLLAASDMSSGCRRHLSIEVDIINQ